MDTSSKVLNADFPQREDRGLRGFGFEKGAGKEVAR
jgi:hypothetical protein